MQSGFFAINFTLAEIQTLQARQALRFRPQNTTSGHRCSSLSSGSSAAGRA